MIEISEAGRNLIITGLEKPVICYDPAALRQGHDILVCVDNGPLPAAHYLYNDILNLASQLREATGEEVVVKI